MQSCRALWVVVVMGWLLTGSAAHAQWRVSADYLLFGRVDSDSSKVIDGPQGLSTDKDYGFTSGYRFGVVGGIDEWEVEAIFSQVDNWSNSMNREYADGIAFDAPSLFPGSPQNVLVFFNALREAASLAPEDEESEFLEAGADAMIRSSSRYRDFEVNFGQNRTLTNLRFGIGYRHIRLNDRFQVGTVGNFNAFDAGTGDRPGDGGNISNDGLSHGALIAAGYINTGGGADGFVGYDPALGIPTLMAAVSNASADNELNGVQGIGAYQFISNERFMLELVGKMGLFHNSVDARLQDYLIGIQNDDSVYLRQFSDSKSTASFLGSLGLQTGIPLTDYITFTAGYEAILLTGLALGSQQSQGVHDTLMGTTTFSARANDSSILHGAKFGLELTF